jgi:hypothetical protein
MELTFVWNSVHEFFAWSNSWPILCVFTEIVFESLNELWSLALWLTLMGDTYITEN